MSFLAPWAWFAALAVPAVVALHLFRRRLAERPVAGLFLWAPRGLTASAGRRRTRLLQSASLWLESLAALVLALWLAGPDLGGSSAARHVVLVFDDSGSMQARDRVGGERAADRARRDALSILAAADADTRVSVVRSGPRPEVVVGPRAVLAEATAAVAAWQPTRPAHDLGPAIDLALGVAGDEAADRTLFTDRADRGLAPASFTIRAYGAALPNTALLHARRVRDAGDQRLFADVVAFGGAARTGELTVGAPGAPAAVRVPFTVAPDAPARLDVAVAIDGPWEVRIAVPDDPLDLDDGGVVLPEPRRVVSVAAALDGDAAALLELARLIASATDVVAGDDPGTAALTFRSAPTRVDAAHHEVVVATPGDARDPWIGPYLVDRRHAAVEGVLLDGVVWTAGRGPLPGAPLVLAGRQALLSEDAALGGGLRYHLNLDPTATNLTSAPDWPILFDGICRRVRERLSGARRHNLAVGEPIEWRLAAPPPDGAAPVLVAPDGALTVGRGGRSLEWIAAVPGVHVLRDAAGAELARFAVRFVDAAESDLGAASTGVLDAAPEPATEAVVGGAADLERRALALLLALLLVADWWVLSRSWGRA